MEKVRILFLVNKLGGGGAEKQFLLIIKHLSQRGHIVACCALSNDSPGGVYLDHKNEAQNSGAIFISGMVDSCLFLQESLISGDNILVWSWGYKAEMIRLFWASSARGVFSIRSASDSQTARWRWLLRFSAPFTSMYISNSFLGVKIMGGFVNDVRIKSRVVFNAIDERFLINNTSLSERPSVLEVLMLGNVRYNVKGYDLALIIGRRIKEAGLPIRIRIGGAQYSNEVDLRDEISKLQLSDVVKWDGPIANSLNFLKEGGAFMLLSRYEGMPNALFEAMALGLPCVATSVGDLQYHADESQGLRVVPVEDVDMAFGELCWIWNNWEQAVAMGKRARKYCLERFSEDRMINDVINALELSPTKLERVI